jgi:hypothetical protein
VSGRESRIRPALPHLSAPRSQPDCGSQQQPAAGQPAAEPVNIEKGMTTDQVEAAMGKPEKKVTLGSKVIYLLQRYEGDFSEWESLGCAVGRENYPKL